MSRSVKRSVVVVTGFLGSGKTTLLLRALAGARDTAVVVNEFGEVGLDHHLLRRTGERTVLLGSGCVCCARREDLVESLLDLLALEGKGENPGLRRVVVETSGLADPAPILFTVSEHPVLRHHFSVDRVITTVDTANGRLHLDNPESVAQIAAADRLLLTKRDLAPEVESLRLADRLRRINPAATLVFSDETDPKSLFEGSDDDARAYRVPPPGASHGGGTASMTDSVSLTFDGPVDWVAFGVWLSMLLHAQGEKVLRVKGMLDVGEAGPAVLNGVQHTVHAPQHLDSWPDGDRTSRLVFITRGLEAGVILASLDAFSGLLGTAPRRLTAGGSPSPSRPASRTG
ncbi:Putative GTPases (G3E family) [Rubrobacter radiotolerans]|uniref:GTP-binding protein n=1 Tax=Rubrobacter radiotolerans TaxID=42256 RepID=A0A023X4L4_RUBRA|nr:GTP-binding protein [Rubrobacter radiotolerans]AHY47131.1 Putative GTPases (G3E family) [Rubrobacter radiotolerans]MDX5894536.1 GTP-binding protein [Rubrobacter radiotolerans]SMC06211.1 GTPase, G3E family [Rubrobacter radiotolerans DSM 5868]